MHTTHPTKEEKKWNYVEFVLCTGNEKNKNAIDINLSENAFLQLLSHLSEKKDTRSNMFLKNITRYFYDDLIYEICNKEIKTLRKTPVDVISSNSTLKLLYYKEKIPFYLFPSTNDIHEVQNISSAIFRFHNSIYLNFDIITYPRNPSASRTYKVYLNYNHEQNIDAEHIQGILKNLQNHISSTGLHFPNFLL